MMAAIENGRSLIRDFLGRQNKRVVSLSHQLLQPPTAGQMVVEYLATLQDDVPNRGGWNEYGRGMAASAALTLDPVTPAKVRGLRPLGKTSLIAKFYVDERGLVAYEAMRALHARLKEDGPCAVPEAYFYDKQLCILAQQRVPGRPCVPLAKDRGNAILPKHLGIALACLHSQRGIAAEVKELTHHVRELINPHPYVLADAYPEYRPLIEAALEILLGPAAEQFHYRVSPIHRDFQLRQLFLAEGQVWVVDWDTFALGDPAFDVAYFLTYLKTHFQVQRYEPFCDAFLDGYLTSQPQSVLERLAVYETFNFLRRACRRFRIRDDNWASELHRMMLQLERTL